MTRLFLKRDGLPPERGPVIQRDQQILDWVKRNLDQPDVREILVKRDKPTRH